MSTSTKTGLVGFFDILGYQNLLEQNEPEVIAEEVLPILIGLKNSIKANIYDVMKLAKASERKKIIEPIVESMEWLVFSDTILLTLAFNENDVSLNHYYWFVFLLASIEIQTQLFNAGLPARGAIDYGKFFVQEGCFAGRCIVKAYKLSSTIEMAACVLSHEAVIKFESIKGVEEDVRSRIFKMLVIPYLGPNEAGGSAHVYGKSTLSFKPEYSWKGNARLLGQYERHCSKCPTKNFQYRTMARVS